MNLSSYDIMIDVNYKKTWIDPRFKRLYSYELPKHRYYSFLKRYNTEDEHSELYLILYDEEEELLKNYICYEKYNIAKYNLHDVWDYFIDSVFELQNVNLTLEETQDDCIIYKFDY